MDETIATLWRMFVESDDAYSTLIQTVQSLDDNDRDALDAFVQLLDAIIAHEQRVLSQTEMQRQIDQYKWTRWY